MPDLLQNHRKKPRIFKYSQNQIVKYAMQKHKPVFPPFPSNVKIQYKKDNKSFNMGTFKPFPNNSGI